MDGYSIDPGVEAAPAFTHDAKPTRVWVGTVDLRETPLDPADAVLGVWTSMEAAVAAIERDEDATVQQAGGFAVPDSPWEAESDFNHGGGTFALLAADAGSITIRPFDLGG